MMLLNERTTTTIVAAVTTTVASAVIVAVVAVGGVAALPTAPFNPLPSSSNATVDALASWSLTALVCVVVSFVALITSLYTHYVRTGQKYVDVAVVVDGSTDQTTKNGKFLDGDYEFIIVGFGVAGASLAATLGRRGRRVLVVERDLGYQERIVGELIQPGGLQTLRALGLGAAIDDADTQPIYGYALYDKGDRHAITVSGDDVAVAECKHHTHLPYPTSTTTGVGAQGRGWHYGRFVEGLRRIAQTYPSVTVIEGVVKSLNYSDDDKSIVTGVAYGPNASKQKKAAAAAAAAAGGDDSKEADTSTTTPKVKIAPIKVSAPLTIVADGCFSMFRSKLSSSVSTKAGSFFGLILRDVELPFPNHGHVILADPTPVLAYPISSNEVRMLIDFPNKVPTGDAMQTYLRTKVLPQLPQVLRPSFLRACDEKDFKVMPNRSVGSSGAAIIPGVMMIGDALNMRHPLTGGGMTCALSDIYSMQQRGFPTSVQMKTDVPRTQAQLNDVATDSQRVACTEFTSAYYNDRGHNATVNMLADALYMVFGGLDADEKRRRGLPLDGPMTDCAFDLRSACFEYLNKRGAFSFGPTALLAVLSRAQLLLVGHFFAVAFYAMYQLLFPFPTPNRIWRAGAVLRAAVRIFDPLLMRESPPLIVRFMFGVARTVFWLPRPKD